jgi:predicted RNA-binding Zn-ribbon protein involved in translation (DUF1610 family)
MTTSTWTIACSGRAVDELNRPTGEPCGKTYARRQVTVGGPDPRYDGWGLAPMPDAQYLARARTAGWKVHVDGGRVDAMCPACGKPSKETAALLRELGKSLPQQGTFDAQP